MKKILFVAMTAMLTLSANAQLKWGVEGGLNLNKVTVNKEFANSDARTGFFIGPKAQFSLPLTGIIVDGALQYSQTSIKYTHSDQANTAREASKTLPYIIIPVNVKYAIGLGSLASLYVSTGPQYNHYCGGHESLECPTGTYDAFVPSDNSWNWNFGFGAHLAKHLQVGLTYSMGIGDNITIGKIVDPANWSTTSSKGKNNYWQLRLAYMF